MKNAIPQMTKHEIIDETVKFYATHKRAVETIDYDDGPRCKYYARGKVCAVGRCMPKDVAKKIESVYGGKDAGSVPGLEDLLEDKYKGHDVAFWLSIQGLHDGDEYWSNGKLNQQGVAQVELLKIRWNG